MNKIHWSKIINIIKTKQETIYHNKSDKQIISK